MKSEQKTRLTISGTVKETYRGRAGPILVLWRGIQQGPGAGRPRVAGDAAAAAPHAAEPGAPRHPRVVLPLREPGHGDPAQPLIGGHVR